MNTENTENSFQIWVNGGGCLLHGVHQQMITVQQVPLFPLRAMSTASIAATVTAASMVFAQFVSFLLQSLNRGMMIDVK